MDDARRTTPHIFSDRAAPCDSPGSHRMPASGEIMTERTLVVPIQLPDGSTVRAEVAAASAGGDAGRRLLSFDDVRADIVRISQFMSETLSAALPDPPRRYGVEFGLKLAVETTGLSTILAKASGEATVLVRLEWERP
jgi:hypothetical protein